MTRAMTVVFLGAILATGCETGSAVLGDGAATPFSDSSGPDTALSQQVAAKIAELGLGEGLPEVQVSPGAARSADIYIQEFKDHLQIRTYTDFEWFAHVRADTNRNGRVDEGVDVMYSSTDSDPCNRYMIDRRHAMDCGSFESASLFFRSRSSRKEEIIRVIPKSELSSDGASAWLEVDVFKRYNWRRLRPIEVRYDYRWPSGAADATN